jgi:phenylalanyl-tRNA synthetase beta chain
MLNLSLRFLRQRVPSLPADAAAVKARLESAGFPVVRVESLAELLKPVVVGRVESLAQHPNADRLKVCTVDDGSETRLQIVTGAGNVVAGAYYPLIRGGTTLPNGTRIKRGKLRGEVSEGMLGSADELELGSDHDGLYTLTGEPAPGTPLTEVIAVSGEVFVLEGNPEVEAVIAALGGEVRPSAGTEPAS